MMLRFWRKSQCLARASVVVLAGGCLLQIGGCGTLIAPTILAVGEQVLFSTLFSLLPIF